MYLGATILADKITAYINHVNENGARPFDDHIDEVRISLTERQFGVIAHDFKVACTIVIGSGIHYDNFNFENYRFRVHYNDRMNKYELRGRTENFITDIDSQIDYFERNY